MKVGKEYWNAIHTFERDRFIQDEPDLVKRYWARYRRDGIDKEPALLMAREIVESFTNTTPDGGEVKE